MATTTTSHRKRRGLLLGALTDALDRSRRAFAQREDRRAFLYDLSHEIRAWADADSVLQGRTEPPAKHARATCGQCGRPYRAKACGPTHAAMWAQRVAARKPKPRRGGGR